MTTSKRLSERKVAKFQKNITKRGLVPETTSKKGNDYPVGPIVLGFFVFVVIGSLSACCNFTGQEHDICPLSDNKDSYKRWDGLSKGRRKFGVIWTSSKTSMYHVVKLEHLCFPLCNNKADDKQNNKQQPAALNSQR
uniref:Ribosome associated membrane protein RAMP4 n=1 Tax=Quercus lobata TaxID=97700 RepID=A0A7N2R5F1_QUELO